MWDNNIKSTTATIDKKSVDKHSKAIKENEKNKTKDNKTLTEPYISSDTDSLDFIIKLNRATTTYDKQIEIEMIKEKRKRRKASEDIGKEIMPRIKNERALGGNTITNKVVKETSSKSHTDQTIHAPTDRTTLDHTSQSYSMSLKSDEDDNYHLTLDNGVENISNVLSSTFADTSTSKPKTVVMITIADKNKTDRIVSHNGESSNCDGSMTKYGPTMDYAKKYELVSKDYDNAINNNTSGADGSHCSKNIDSNPLNSDNTSQGLDQNIGSDLKIQKYNGASSCYDNNTKIVHIYEATKQEKYCS